MKKVMALVSIALMLAACSKEQKEEVKPDQVNPNVAPPAPAVPTNSAPPK
jgi:PBP1b-binding outer membrane lipoprotein LpoB